MGKLQSNQKLFKMRIFKSNLFTTGLLTLLLFAGGCKKNETLVIAEPQAHFTNVTGGTYQITGPTVVKKIAVGLTNTSDQARTVTFSVTSPTGAVAGTHYNIPGGNTITIPAGKAVDSITVAGVFSQYTSGRKDTLVFTITEPSVKSSTYNSKYTLYMRGPCFEGDVTLSSLLGAYANTRETFGSSPYGPYRTTISSAVSTGATTARITVTNIWDNGWGPIQFDLDWTDPANRTATVVAQNAVTGSNAGDINGAYAGQTVAVRPFAGQPGTFSACNGTLTLKMQLGVTGVGYFGSLYTVNMAR